MTSSNIGTRLLNQYVAHYTLKYINSVNLEQTGTPIDNAVWRFLKLSGIPWYTDPGSIGYLAEKAALFQRKRVLENNPRSSMRHIIKDHHPELEPLIAHGPQAWLIFTYLDALSHILELDNGSKTYGPKPKGDVYRDITENVQASRLMFAPGTQRIAKKMVELYGDTPNLALFEGGAGNGAATLTTLKAFQSAGKYPVFLLSDRDEATLPVAIDYFQQNGFSGNKLPWMKVDIGSVSDLKDVAQRLTPYTPVITVNFIIHELENIADQLFSAVSQTITNADLVISEFFLPPGYPNCRPDPDFPWWFVFLHELSGQHLRTERDFLKFPNKYGYQLIDRLDHQVHNNKAVTSTMFFRKK